MKHHIPLKRLIVLILALAIATSPILAQRKPSTHPPLPPPAPAEPDPTFDTLLASDTFKVYCEARSVGALIRSSALTDILDPILKIGQPPKEFKLLVKWLNAHAETLAGSRMLVAGWPSRPGLPDAVVAVEFSSPEEAKKFYPDLRDFLPRLFPTPTPEPSPSSSSAPGAAPNVQNNVSQKPNVTGTAGEPAKLPYQLKQVGSLILISDTPFNVRDLRPRGTRGLEEDPNFAMARSRLSSESLFLYIDFKAIEKEELDRGKRAEEEERKREQERAAHPPKEEKAEEPDEVEPDDPESPVTVTPNAEPQETPPATVEAVPQTQPTLEASQPTEESVRNAEFGSMLSLFSMAVFAGDRKWPEAMGLAVNFEGDAYVARSLIVNGDETRDRPIPFMPQLISGPPITPQAPDVLPGDVDLFVTASLNYQQIYENTLNAVEKMRGYSDEGNQRTGEKSEGPIANLEKKLGLKIKDDLLPLLGNEFALALPKPPKKPEAPESDATKSNTTVEPAMNPVIAIGIKDRDAVEKIIPKLLEASGIKAAKLIAQKENHDGAEIVSYGPFAYALIDNFLVLSPDSDEIRRTVDAYVNHQTLSSDSTFRNSTRWEPRQVVGQIYVGPKIVQQYLSGRSIPFGENMTDYMGRVNPVIDPLTYTITNDSSGSFHELHAPKSLVQMVVAIASADVAESPMRVNEARAQGALHSLAAGEQEFRNDKGAGSYGTMDQLLSAGLTSKELIEGYGYRVELMVTGTKFEVTAVPTEYGTTGRLSFFIDESNTIRGGDHGGAPATVADKPLGQ